MFRPIAASELSIRLSENTCSKENGKNTQKFDDDRNGTRRHAFAGGDLQPPQTEEMALASDPMPPAQAPSFFLKFSPMQARSTTGKPLLLDAIQERPKKKKALSLTRGKCPKGDQTPPTTKRRTVRLDDFVKKTSHEGKIANGRPGKEAPRAGRPATRGKVHDRRKR